LTDSSSLAASSFEPGLSPVSIWMPSPMSTVRCHCPDCVNRMSSVGSSKKDRNVTFVLSSLAARKV
jgi:hypothetical protein